MSGPPRRISQAETVGEPPNARHYLGIHRVDAYCAARNQFWTLDLAALIEAGQGDVQLIRLPLRCSACGAIGHKIIVSGRSYPLWEKGTPLPPA